MNIEPLFISDREALAALYQWVVNVVPPSRRDDDESALLIARVGRHLRSTADG